MFNIFYKYLSVDTYPVGLNHHDPSLMSSEQIFNIDLDRIFLTSAWFFPQQKKGVIST
jgi:hypothetical protein